MRFKVHSLSELSLTVLGDRPPESENTEKEITKIWDEQKRARGHRLTNGEILCIERFDEKSIHALRTDYRHFLAQRLRPELFQKKPVMTLAVTGVLSFEGKLMFGLRASHVTQDAGHWELGPSGGLTDTDFKKQLATELEEETGLKSSAVKKLTPFALVEDYEGFTADIGLEGTLTSLDGLQKKTDEYDEILFVPLSDIKKFCASNEVIESTKLFLKHKKLI